MILGKKFKKLLELAEKIGIKVSVVKEHDYAWDGKVIRINRNREHEMVEDLSHELAHWIVASPSRRKLKEYGLGSGVTGKAILSEIKSVKFSNIEEKRASILGLVIMNHVGVDCRSTFFNHSWHMNMKGALDSLFWLQKNVFIKQSIYYEKESDIVNIIKSKELYMQFRYV